MLAHASKLDTGVRLAHASYCHMPETFIPLFTSTVRSSLWSLSGDCLKVFLTLALEAGPDGVVSASIDGIRRIVDMPIAEVECHIRTLEAPDPYSKDRKRAPKGDGRRIESVENGWRVVNLEWYREEARRQAELFRKRKWWNEKGSTARREARPTETETETGSGSDQQIPKPPPPTRDPDPKRARKPRVKSIVGGGVARTFSLPSADPPQEYLDEALIRGVSREQATSTWSYWWGAGLPERGVERLFDWMCRSAKERMNATTGKAKGRKGDSVQPSLGKTGWETLEGKKL